MNNTTTTAIIDITADSDNYNYYPDYRNRNNYIDEIIIRSLAEILKYNRMNYKILRKANLRLKKNKYFNNYY